MTSNYLDMTLADFLDTVTSKRNQYRMTIGEAKIHGTKPEFEVLISKLDQEQASSLSSLIADLEEYTTPFELTQLEIYNYLEKITSKFDPIKVKLILNEFEVYYTMDLSERVNQESLNIYTYEDWEIPQIEFKPLILIDGSLTVDHLPDYETMRRKTHLFEYWNIDFAIGVLKDKLKDDDDLTKESLRTVSPFVSNLHHQIFNNGGYDLFLYLVQNYTRDDKTPKAKFSNLFHYLKHEQLILCTQLQYISFIEEELKVKLSKILPSNYKYSEQIQPILGRLRSDFLQNLKA